MALVSNLYPPIVPDTTIVFSNTCRIPFTLSAYNSIDDIKNIQVSLVNLRTNASAFNDDIVNNSSGIKIITWTKDLAATHYIEIESSDMSGNAFEEGQFYKVQLRFTHKNAPNIENNDTANWLYQNR
jgi:hypothetical protein